MKEYNVIVSLQTNPQTGKKKIVGFRFADNSIQKLIDLDFIKSGKKLKRNCKDQ